MDLERSCPRCPDVGLTDFPDNGLVVDYCPNCRGLWCDRGELEQLVGEPLDPAVLPLPFPLGIPTGPACPACPEGRLVARSTQNEDPVELFDCVQCGGTWLDGGVLQRLRKVLRDRRVERQARQPRPRLERPSPSSTLATQSSYQPRLPFGVPIVRVAALPIAFLIGLVLSNSPRLMIVVFPMQLTLHEFGHTIAAWLSGRMAVPVLIAAQTWVGGERSVLVILGLAASLGFLGWLAIKERKPFTMAAVILFLLAQLFLTFVATADQSEMWDVFAGLGGEILLSTLIIVAFYYPAPDRLRWDFWRYILLVPAAIVFCSNYLLWLKVRRDPSYMPMGAAVGPNSNGDLNRLIGDWGWSVEQISTSYLSLATFCGLIIAGHYVFFLVRAGLGGSSRDLSTG